MGKGLSYEKQNKYMERANTGAGAGAGGNTGTVTEAEGELKWMQALAQDGTRAQALVRAQVQAQDGTRAQVQALVQMRAQAQDGTRALAQMRAQMQALVLDRALVLELNGTMATVWELAEMLTLVRNSSATQKNTIITLLSRFLCESARTEWVDDLCERRATWREQELSSWMIHIRTAGEPAASCSPASLYGLRSRLCSILGETTLEEDRETEWDGAKVSIRYETGLRWHVALFLGIHPSGTRADPHFCLNVSIPHKDQLRQAIRNYKGSWLQKG